MKEDIEAEKLKRVFELIKFLLIQPRGILDITEYLGCTTRTTYRYIKLLKKVGFEFERLKKKQEVYYKIKSIGHFFSNKDNKKYKLVTNKNEIKDVFYYQDGKRKERYRLSKITPLYSIEQAIVKRKIYIEDYD